MSTIKILGNIAPYSKANCNCNGCLVIENNSKILLDCGFGISSKLNFPSDLNNLSIIISHYHMDHFADLFAIGYASYCYNKLEILKERVKLYIPKVEKNELGYNEYLFIISNKNNFFDIITYDSKSILNIENYQITFFETYHSIRNYSIKLENKDSKIVYSGDMGYSNIDDYLSFCDKANLFICESTFLSSDNAHNRFHLTASEAALIALKSSVKKLILTHMWPEYDKKLYLNEAKLIFKETYVFDNVGIININN